MLKLLKNRRAIGSGSVLAVLVGLTVAALPSTQAAAKSGARPAAKPSGFSIFVSSNKTSSTHKKLRVGISGSQFGSQSVSFGVSAKGARDTHTWSFAPLSNGSVTYNAGTGKGVIKTGKQAKPYAKATLKIKDKGKKQVSKCGNVKSITQPIVARGKWLINTHSHGKNKWGKASRRGKFSGSVSYSVGSGGCNPPIPCNPGVSWSVSTEGLGFFGSVTRKNLSANRTVALSKANASRSDNVFLTHKSQTFSVKHGKATVTVGSGPGTAGSATLSGPQGTTGGAAPCGKGGKTQTTTSWSASAKSGKQPFVVKEQIFGALKLPKASVGSGVANISKTVKH